MVAKDDLYRFLKESNEIEAIYEVTVKETEAALKFLALTAITIEDLEEFVIATQPDAQLRSKLGMNVRIGNHHPTAGGPLVKLRLQVLLTEVNAGAISPYEAHIDYELLHPFTDGNGRSGRMLWLWQVRAAPRGFLHEFYYQALRQAEKNG